MVLHDCLTLCFAGMKRYCWRRVSTVRYLASTSTFTGLSKHALCSFATLVVMVAEKSCVLLSFGITCVVLHMIRHLSFAAAKVTVLSAFRVVSEDHQVAVSLIAINICIGFWCLCMFA